MHRARAARGRGRPAWPGALGARPRRIADVEVLHPRAVRRHLRRRRRTSRHRLAGLTLGRACGAASTCGCCLDGRRGAAGPPRDERPAAAGAAGRPRREAPAGPVRASTAVTPRGAELRFVDQRTFGGLAVCRSNPPRTGDRRGWAPPVRRLPCCRHRGPHRPRPARPATFDERRPPGPAPPSPDRDQAGPARPDADQRGRQHLRGRGPVAGPAALRPRHREPDPAGRAETARRTSAR